MRWAVPVLGGGAARTEQHPWVSAVYDCSMDCHLRLLFKDRDRVNCPYLGCICISMSASTRLSLQSLANHHRAAPSPQPAWRPTATAPTQREYQRRGRRDDSSFSLSISQPPFLSLPLFSSSVCLYPHSYILTSLPPFRPESNAPSARTVDEPLFLPLRHAERKSPSSPASSASASPSSISPSKGPHCKGP